MEEDTVEHQTARRRSLDDARRKPYEQDRYHTDSEVALDFQSVADSADNRPTGSFITGSNSCPSPISFDAHDSDSDEESSDDVELGSKRLAFLFSTLAPSADLVNIWRFPYIVYRHGGIILAPFVAVYLIIGLPLYYLELILGQAILKRKCCGEKTMGKIIPVLKGMTISSAILLAITSVYYMTVISWALVYLFVSLQESLPWSPCTDSSSPFGCLSANNTESKTNCPEDDLYCNSTLPRNSWQDYLSLDAITSSHNGNENHTDIESRKHFQTSSFLEFESISVKQILAIFTAWIFVYMNVMKGKVYFKKTAVLPSLLLVLFLFILLGKATGQHGFQNGLRVYFDFRVAPLSKPELWSDVVTQVVLSLGIGTGAVHRIGQRSPPSCSLLQDAMAVAVTNIGVTFISGIVTFACLGSLASSTHSKSLAILLTDIEASFVGLPAVLATLPGAVVCAVLFFSMLSLLSLRRQKFFILALAATLPNSFFSSRKRTRLTMLVICSFLFSCGIVFATKAGIRLLTIIDVYVIGYVALLLCLLECTALIWMYGTKRFFKAFEDSQRAQLHLSWKLIWLGVVPFILMFLLVFMLLSHQMPFEDDEKHEYKHSVIGWFLLTFAILPIPAYASFCAAKAAVEGNGKTRLQSLKRICHPCFGEDCALVRTRNCTNYSTSHMLVIRVPEDSGESCSIPSIPYGFVIQPKKKASRMSKFSTTPLLSWGKSPLKGSPALEDTPGSTRTISEVYWEDGRGSKQSLDLHSAWKRTHFTGLTRSKSMPLSPSAQDVNLVSSSMNARKDSTINSAALATKQGALEEGKVTNPSSIAAKEESKCAEVVGGAKMNKEKSKSFDNPAFETETTRAPT